MIYLDKVMQVSRLDTGVENVAAEMDAQSIEGYRYYIQDMSLPTDGSQESRIKTIKRFA